MFLWQLVMYFCVHICTCPSYDYTAVACSNKNQAQLHTQVSVPYWSPDVCLSLELLRDSQFGLLNNSLASYDNNYACHERICVTGSGQMFGCATPLSKFLNLPLETILCIARHKMSWKPSVACSSIHSIYLLFQIVVCHLWRQKPLIKDFFHPASNTVDRSLSCQAYRQSSKFVDGTCTISC